MEQYEDYMEKLLQQRATLSADIQQNVYAEMFHGVQVSNYAYEIAKEMGKSDSFCNGIVVAGLLHDIGKLRLNRYLEQDYTKKLVVEQLSYVRQHTYYSMVILEEHNYPLELCEAVFYHHENVDGSGYPHGIMGERIPEMSRILRVCDVFTALTSDRPYRRGFEPDVAMEMMIAEVMSYDMKVFLAFQRFYHSDRFRELDTLSTNLTDLQKIHLLRFVEEAEKSS